MRDHTLFVSLKNNGSYLGVIFPCQQNMFLVNLKCLLSNLQQIHKLVEQIPFS